MGIQARMMSKEVIDDLLRFVGEYRLDNRLGMLTIDWAILLAAYDGNLEKTMQSRALDRRDYHSMRVRQILYDEGFDQDTVGTIENDMARMGLTLTDYIQVRRKQ